MLRVISSSPGELQPIFDAILVRSLEIALRNPHQARLYPILSTCLYLDYHRLSPRMSALMPSHRLAKRLTGAFFKQCIRSLACDRALVLDVPNSVDAHAVH